MSGYRFVRDRRRDFRINARPGVRTVSGSTVTLVTSGNGPSCIAIRNRSYNAVLECSIEVFTVAFAQTSSEVQYLYDAAGNLIEPPDLHGLDQPIRVREHRGRLPAGEPKMNDAVSTSPSDEHRAVGARRTEIVARDRSGGKRERWWRCHQQLPLARIDRCGDSSTTNNACGSNFCTKLDKTRKPGPRFCSLGWLFPRENANSGVDLKSSMMLCPRTAN